MRRITAIYKSIGPVHLFARFTYAASWSYKPITIVNREIDVTCDASEKMKKIITAFDFKDVSFANIAIEKGMMEKAVITYAQADP